MVGELAHATNRDQKDMLLERIGSPRIVKLDSAKDPWNYGEPYDSYPIDTARLRRVIEVVIVGHRPESVAANCSLPPSDPQHLLRSTTQRAPRQHTGWWQSRRRMQGLGGLLAFQARDEQLRARAKVA